NKRDEVVYIGDSTKLQSRWHAGHLNEFRQGERAQTPYKPADEFKEGCTVKFVVMDSEETAAALEADLIRTEKPRANKREELLNEQGKRANIEAKKMKDAAGSTASKLQGAAKEAAENSGWMVLEQLTAAALKALKDELVDIFGGGESTILARLQRFCEKVWSIVKRIIAAPLQLLKGIFEFIVNALSKTIRQIYQLARNIFDLASAAWSLFKEAGSMSREDLVRKITETIIVSGTLVIWDGLDPVIESQLLPLLGPVAPYLAAAISAMGFGLSSHYLQQFVPNIVEFLINSRTGHHEALQAQREACMQLITLNEQQFETINVLGRYVESSLTLEIETKAHIRALSPHSAIKPLDIRNLLASSK
ncbi:MAG: GIY-YIG nuclease family protein, partial [Achromobacter piechaudii]